MKTHKKTFLRSFYLSLVIFSCLFIGMISAARVYKNTMQTRYGEYKSAFEITEEYIRFFDFEIKR